MAKILIVEDDRIIVKGIKTALKQEGHEVIFALDGEDGLYAARTENPDLIILDIMMPYMNGFEVTTEIRRIGDEVPILILSARMETKDKVRGLDLGADDYLAKPFDIDELLARVRRLLKRKTPSTESIGNYVYNFENQTLSTTEGSAVALSPREQRLLEFFLKRKDRIVSREQIIENVWGSDYEGTDRTVDNFIVALRKKIGTDTLMTVRGQGYRFVTPAAEMSAPMQQ